MTTITQIFIGIAFDTNYLDLDHCKSAKRDKMLKAKHTQVSHLTHTREPVCVSVLTSCLALHFCSDQDTLYRKLCQ